MSGSMRGLWCVVAVALLAGCGGGGPAPLVTNEVGSGSPVVPGQRADFPTSSPPPSGGGGVVTLTIGFTDVTAQAGLTHTSGFSFQDPYEAQDVTGGAAAGDYDNDGKIDLCLLGGDQGKVLLYRNLGNGTFAEKGQEAGVAISSHKRSGPSFADYDGDGDLDLFIGGVDNTAPVLFRNKGNGTFEDATTASGLVITRTNTLSAAWGDYDNDGDIDLILAHWSGQDSWNIKEVLWRNKGDGTFEDVTEASGLKEALGVTLDYMLAPNFTDIDADGDCDLLLTSDFNTTLVLRNDGDGTFTDITDTSVITDENGMGPAIGDYDNDGDLDWFVTSIFRANASELSGNRFYRNDGTGVYTDVTSQTGTRDGGWGWAASFQDFDNDGWLDIFHVNGWGKEPEPPRLFMSTRNGAFSNLTTAAGLSEERQGRGMICLDYDGDGDIDILISSWPDEPFQLLRNDGGNASKWLQVDLKGKGKNTAAAGAWVWVTAGGRTQLREVRLGNNYVSSDPLTQHFGLFDNPIATEVKVRWPDGSTTTKGNVAANQRVVIEQK